MTTFKHQVDSQLAILFHKNIFFQFKSKALKESIENLRKLNATTDWENFASRNFHIQFSPSGKVAKLLYSVL